MPILETAMNIMKMKASTMAVPFFELSFFERAVIFIGGTMIVQLFKLNTNISKFFAAKDGLTDKAASGPLPPAPVVVPTAVTAAAADNDDDDDVNNNRIELPNPRTLDDRFAAGPPTAVDDGGVGAPPPAVDNGVDTDNVAEDIVDDNGDNGGTVEVERGPPTGGPPAAVRSSTPKHVTRSKCVGRVLTPGRKRSNSVGRGVH